MTTKKKKPATGVAYKRLTVAEKAEAIALYRSGKVTLDDLGKKFKKRPEAFSRLFTRMGIVKGAAIEEMSKKLEAVVEARALSDVEETLKKIAQTRDEHFRMSSSLAKFAWAELIRARQAGIDIATLKDLMTTLKIAGEVVGSARKELFAILNVDKHDKESDFENLPELTVRELSGSELLQLQSQSVEDLNEDGDAGDDMMSETLLGGI
jgi:hypothetical protein